MSHFQTIFNKNFLSKKVLAVLFSIIFLNKCLFLHATLDPLISLSESLQLLIREQHALPTPTVSDEEKRLKDEEDRIKKEKEEQLKKQLEEKLRQEEEKRLKDKEEQIKKEAEKRKFEEEEKIKKQKEKEEELKKKIEEEKRLKDEEERIKKEAEKRKFEEEEKIKKQKEEEELKKKIEEEKRLKDEEERIKKEAEKKKLELAEKPVSKEQESSFLNAVKTGDTAQVQEYLKTSKKFLKSTDEDGKTAIDLALSNRHLKTASALILAGGDVSKSDASIIINDYWETPIFIAAREGNLELFNALVEKSDLTKKNMLNQSLLHVAAAGGNGKILEQLLTKIKPLPITDPFNPPVKPVNFQDTLGQTALHKAVISRNLDACKVLINYYYTHVNDPDKTGKKPLYYANKDDVDIIKLLLKKGAEKSDINTQGESLNQFLANRGIAVE